MLPAAGWHGLHPLHRNICSRAVTRSVAFSPEGTKLATASSDKTARLWDAATCQPLGAPMKHDKPVSAVAFSPDGTKLATASEDSTARLWDATTCQPLGSLMWHGDDVTTVAFGADGTKVITEGARPGYGTQRRGKLEWSDASWWGRSCPTPGACTICMGTCSSGVGTGTTKTTMRRRRRWRRQSDGTFWGLAPRASRRRLVRPGGNLPVGVPQQRRAGILVLTVWASVSL